ncbi:MAG: hypothetical protein ACYDCO_03650 [Armatimonadota bacterium]
MKTTLSLRVGLLALAGLAWLFFLAGCGGGSGGETPPSNITPINPVHDQTLPGAVGGTVFTLAPGPNPAKPQGIIDQAMGATITLTGTTYTGASYNRTTTSVIRGGYNFPDVPEGTYTLTGTVQAPYGLGTMLTGQVSGIRVRGNIPTLMANLMLFEESQAATVKGTVYQNGAPAGGATVSVEMWGYPVDYLGGPANPVYCTLSTATSTEAATLGQYEFRVPADGINYYISAHSDNSYTNDIQPQKYNRQVLDFGGTVTGGTFTLSIGRSGNTYTTAALAYNISNASLQSAVEGLLSTAGYTGATVSIEGGPGPADATIAIGGAGASAVPLIIANSSLTGAAATVSVQEDWRILLAGEVRANQDITLVTAVSSLFPSVMMDIVCSTLPAPTELASEQAMITRLSVARNFKAPRNRLAQMEDRARQSRTTRNTATGLIENDLYWTADDVSEIRGFHIYRGVQSGGNFIYMGSAQDPYQWYFFDNDPALPLDAARYYTILSYGPNGQVSQPAKPVIMALPLPQINVLGPADNHTSTGTNVQFSWAPVTNAQSYVLTIYPTRPTYNTSIVYEEVYDDSETSVPVSLNSGDYWWSVSAYNNADPNYATAISYAAYRKLNVP